MSLDDIRKKIDALDGEIVRLLDLRAEAGRAAAEEKNKLGLPLRNPEREREVLAGLARRGDGRMPGRSLENIFRAVIAETLSLEEHDVCRGHAPGGPIRDVTAEIIENTETAPGFYRMRLRVPELAGSFSPGQFFQIRVDGGGNAPLLRRPFAPSEYANDGFAFVYAVVGGGTKRMTELRPGHKAGLLAPLGRPYTPLPAGKRALLVGGGCGAPSLAPLAADLTAAGVSVTAIMGSRNAATLLERDACARACDRLIIATDDGSLGCRGTVIDAYHAEGLGPEPFDRIYSCGPTPMLRGVAALADELGTDCEVSLEERMACGFGACVGCAVPVADAGGDGGYVYRRVCHDGPVFNAADLRWDLMR